MPFFKLQLSSRGREPLSRLSRCLWGWGAGSGALASGRDPHRAGGGVLARGALCPAPTCLFLCLPRLPANGVLGVMSSYATSRQVHPNYWRLSENFGYLAPFFLQSLPSAWAEGKFAMSMQASLCRAKKSGAEWRLVFLFSPELTSKTPWGQTRLTHALPCPPAKPGIGFPSDGVRAGVTTYTLCSLKPDVKESYRGCH